MCPKDADGMANSVNPDQTAPLLMYIFFMFYRLNQRFRNSIFNSNASLTEVPLLKEMLEVFKEQLGPFSSLSFSDLKTCFHCPCENKTQLCVKAAEKPAFLQLFCVFLRKLQKSCGFF